MNIDKSLLITLTSVMVTGGCAVTPPPSQAAPPEISNEVRAGAKLYAQHCASCHGANADGGARAPSLHRQAVQEMPDAGLVRFLTDGDLPKGMPSWSRLPEERRWQLARYIKSLPASSGSRGSVEPMITATVR
jgi:mono/diheme cytochrome c family protein